MGFGLGDLNPVRALEGKGAIGESGLAPLIAGVALGPAGFGLMGAGMAGLTVGGISALASGNLGQGLMAGLGAYGGASLSGALSGMGEQSLAAKQAGLEEMAAHAGAPAPTAPTPTMFDKLGAGANYAAENPQEALKQLGDGSMMKGAGILGAAASPILANQMVQTSTPAPSQTQSLIRPYTFQRQTTTPANMVQPLYQPGQSTAERNWFNDSFIAQPVYAAPGPEYKKLAGGGPVEAMSNANAIGANNSFPGAGINHAAYATPWQTPTSQNVVTGTADTGVNQINGQEVRFDTGGAVDSYAGMPRYAYDRRSGFSPQNGVIEHPAFAYEGGTFRAMPTATPVENSGLAALTAADMPHFTFDPSTQGFTRMADGGMAGGGVGSLGGYSDGGRLLKGPGDGVSDSIPATIGQGQQPARLADGEFVVPARIVSELGNGSTDAGAKQLYKMMDRVQAGRRKTTGKNQVAANTRAASKLPA